MTDRCGLDRHPKACVVTQLNHPRPECRECATGKKNDGIVAAKMAGESTRPDPVETMPAKPETRWTGNGAIRPKKEEAKEMSEGKPANERVLSRILREKACGRSRLMNFSGVSSAELDVATRELEKEGKINSWANGRSCIYTPPGAPDPWAGKRKVAPSNDATKASETPQPANRRPIRARKPATPAKEKVAKPAAGNGVFAEAIADLEARRAKIDTAIAALRELM